MSLAMTKQEREAFLMDVRIGVLTLADGELGPLTCPVWYRYEPGGDIVFVTGKASKKAARLRAAGRASFLVQSEELPYKYVSIEGPVVGLDDADVDADVRPIAHRYLGRELGDEYVTSTRAENPAGDVVVRLRPERWQTVDYAKRFATV
jgi:nitroimidazol reductase NimA-like FMN-containing flavoprotein (pyridoxamine 5'-phosphate oxidase superfamily)